MAVGIQLNCYSSLDRTQPYVACTRMFWTLHITRPPLATYDFIRFPLAIRIPSLDLSAHPFATDFARILLRVEA